MIKKKGILLSSVVLWKRKGFGFHKERCNGLRLGISRRVKRLRPRTPISVILSHALQTLNALNNSFFQLQNEVEI